MPVRTVDLLLCVAIGAAVIAAPAASQTTRVDDTQTFRVTAQRIQFDAMFLVRCDAPCGR